jgi:hypothetical protein
MKTLPQTIFIAVEDPDTDDAYLNAQDDKNDLVEMGQVKTIGVYELLRTTSIRGIAVEN